MTILTELEKPGRDPRPEFKTATFRDGVESLADLQPGMVLEGVVTNVAAFGAFVDIGVHQDRLVHRVCAVEQVRQRSARSRETGSDREGEGAGRRCAATTDLVDALEDDCYSLPRNVKIEQKIVSNDEGVIQKEDLVLAFENIEKTYAEDFEVITMFDKFDGKSTIG